MHTHIKKPSTLVSTMRVDLLKRINYFSTYIYSMAYEQDILVFCKDRYIRFILTLAALVEGRKIYFVENKIDLQKFILTKSIGIIFVDDSYPIKLFGIGAHVVNINVANTKMYPSIDRWVDEYTLNTPLKNGGKLTTDLMFKLINDMYYSKVEAIHFVKRNDEFVYSYRNIWAAMEAIDSEFSNNKASVIDFTNTSFEAAFAYMIYFFFQPVILNLNVSWYERSFSELKNKKTIYFYGREERRIKTEFMVKEKTFTKFMEFIKRYTPWTNPILYLINTITLVKVFTTKFKDEAIFLDFVEKTYLSEVLGKHLAKISYTFGGMPTMNTLGINRYDDKNVKHKNSEFAILNRDPDFKCATNSLNQLLVTGNVVAENKKTELSKATEKRELFYNTNMYCKVKGDVIEKIALQEDIYYTNDFDQVNIGYIKEALIKLPYVKRAVVMLSESKDRPGEVVIVPMVSINTDIAKKAFGFSEMFTIRKHILDRLHLLVRPKKGIIIGLSIVNDNMFVEKSRLYKSDYDFVSSVSNSFVNQLP